MTNDKTRKSDTLTQRTFQGRENDKLDKPLL